MKAYPSCAVHAKARRLPLLLPMPCPVRLLALLGLCLSLFLSLQAAQAAEPLPLKARAHAVELVLDAGRPHALLLHADAAMYAGKQAGRGCLRRWVPDAQTAAAPHAPAQRPGEALALAVAPAD